MTISSPLYQQPKVYPARADRQFIGDIFKPGVFSAADLKVTVTGNANEVSITRGVGYVAGTMNADQGTYRFFSDATETRVLSAPATFPRVDLIAVQIFDDTERINDPTGSHYGDIIVFPGVETNGATTVNRSGAPSDGSLPANLLKLAYTLVPVGSAPLPSGNVVEARKMGGLKSSSAVPIGTMVPWVGGIEPTDGFWTLAEGKLIDRTLYDGFYAWAGHAYNGGVDPGSNKVRVPDRRGRFSVGPDSFGTALGAAGRISGSVSRGGVGGAETISLTAAQNGAHEHGAITGIENVSLAHTHNLGGALPARWGGNAWSWTGGTLGDTGVNVPYTNANPSPRIVEITESGGTPDMSAHTHNLVTDWGGSSGAPHSNMPPFQADFWIVKIA